MNSKQLALQLVKYRHEKALAEREVRIVALRKDNEFCLLEQNLDSLQWESAKNRAYDKIDTLVEEIEKAESELESYFTKNNLPIDCLNVKVHCPLCNDSGIRDGSFVLAPRVFG